jgi:hypothetical protein
MNRFPLNFNRNIPSRTSSYSRFVGDRYLWNLDSRLSFGIALTILPLKIHTFTSKKVVSLQLIFNIHYIVITEHE